MEGTTFQQVLDETRFEAARQLLDYTRIPLTEIAASVGYSESRAFSRAFRRWSGGPPSYKRSPPRDEGAPSIKEERGTSRVSLVSRSSFAGNIEERR
jgi:AraC-like DNA-binding protein